MSDSTPLATEPYKGVRDFYPQDWARLLAAFTRIRSTLHAFGFEEYNASPLERAELYESKTSEEIVNEQTYTFEDRGGRRVTIRPEMTPTLARMVAGKRHDLTFPVRWFSIPNVFRYERPQRGRLREHYQLNVDILGIKDQKADGEILVIASSIMRSFGATDTDFVIRINSRTLLNAAAEGCGLSEEDTKSYLSLLDRKNKLAPEVFETERAPFRRNGMDPLELIESGTNEAVAAEYEKLKHLIDGFNARGMENVVYDPTIVRGFLYYTGLVFEVFDTNPLNPRALFGGGRYDNLISLFGGDPIPAIGFGMGDVTLMDFLETHDLLPDVRTGADLFIGTFSEDSIAAAQELAATLREQNVNVLVHVSGKNIGDQVKEAVKRTIPYFLAYGENEATTGIVKIKELATGSETEMPLSEIAGFVTK